MAKFRAYDTKHKKMLSWEELCDPSIISLSAVLRGDLMGDVNKVIPEQCTEYVDIDNVDLYEGDRIEVLKDDGAVSYETTIGSMCDALYNQLGEHKFRIIGTVHEEEV